MRAGAKNCESKLITCAAATRLNHRNCVAVRLHHFTIHQVTNKQTYLFINGSVFRSSLRGSLCSSFRGSFRSSLRSSLRGDLRGGLRGNWGSPCQARGRQRQRLESGPLPILPRGRGHSGYTWVFVAAPPRRSAVGAQCRRAPRRWARDAGAAALEVRWRRSLAADPERSRARFTVAARRLAALAPYQHKRGCSRGQPSCMSHMDGRLGRRLSTRYLCVPA